ncbi:hypothetical protein BDW22DRAFT_1300349, partial [Trametopsis cervina]
VTTPSLFADLPSELILNILEHAAAASVATALSLSRVSSWVRSLTEPFLFHTVVLSTSRALASFHAALLAKPPAFAAAHVKHLGILAPGPVETIDKVLDRCTSVHSLACGFSLPAYKDLHPTISSSSDEATPTPAVAEAVPQQRQPLQALHRAPALKEQHLLALSCRDGWDVSLVSPSVTHLRVHVTSPQRPWFPQVGGNTTLEASSWDLSYLPALTHLAVVWRPAKGQRVEDVLVPLTRLLGSEPHPTHRNDHNDEDEDQHRLSVILIQILGPRSAQATAVRTLNEAAVRQGGRAVRVVAEAAPLSAVSQWEDGVRCGSGTASVWSDAEDVVARRLS